MQIFGVGILEIIFILIIALIVLGPEGMVKTGYSIGRMIRKIIRSPVWRMMMDTQRDLRDIPTRLVREAGLEEDLEEFKKSQREVSRLTREELESLDLDENPAKPAAPRGSVASEQRIAPPPVAAPRREDAEDDKPGDGVPAQER